MTAGSERSFELEMVACDLCGSTRSRPVMRKAGALWTHVFTIVRCSRCGLIYENPRIAEHQMGELYDDEYYRGEGFDRTIDYLRDDPDDPDNRASAERVLATLGDAVGSLHGKRVLDVGCGTGALLRAFQRAGADAEGLESAEAARRRCTEHGLTIVAGDLRDPQVPTGAYDVVTAIEVIEHVPSPTAFLRRIRELLKPGGVFYYTTGNWHLVSRQPGTPYVMPEGHIYYFTPRTMSRYLSKTGFDVVPVLNRAWIGYRALPAPVRRTAPPGLLYALSHLFGDIGQYPVARRSAA